jgi:hypothetical protein
MQALQEEAQFGHRWNDLPLEMDCLSTILPPSLGLSLHEATACTPTPLFMQSSLDQNCFDEAMAEDRLSLSLPTIETLMNIEPLQGCPDVLLSNCLDVSPPPLSIPSIDLQRVAVSSPPASSRPDVSHKTSHAIKRARKSRSRQRHRPRTCDLPEEELQHQRKLARQAATRRRARWLEERSALEDAMAVSVQHAKKLESEQQQLQKELAILRDVIASRARLL